MLTQERLQELFTYDPKTGWFRNRFSRGRACINCRAGAEAGHGYRRIIIDYNKYYEHHLAWFYTTGEWPGEIDHIDGNRSNNAIANLRLCDRTENCFNTPRSAGGSGLRGAYLDKRTQRWYSHIQVRRKVEHLGMFDTAEEAHAAFMAAVERYHGEFAFHNRPAQLAT
jgi:hypothetical protein